MSDKNSYPHYKSSPSWGKRDYNNRNKTMDINKYTQKIRNTSGRRSNDVLYLRSTRHIPVVFHILPANQYW